MPKQPDPNCPFCEGAGLVTYQETEFRCQCTSDQDPNDLPLSKERVV